MMPRRDAVAHTPRGGEKLAFAVLGANGLSTLALLALAVKQSRPYAPDAQTAAFAHLNRIAAFLHLLKYYISSARRIQG